MARELVCNDEGKILFREARANGVNDVGMKAPATLAASYTITHLSALPGSAEFLQIDNTGLLTTSAGSGNTLDQSYDQGGAGSGRTITASDGTVQINVTAANSGLDINKTNAGAGDVLNVANAGTGIGFDLDQTGIAIALRSQQNADTTNLQINKLGSGVGTNILADNSGTGINIFSNQDGNGIGISIDSEATSQPLLELLPLDSNTRGDIAFGTARTADPTTPSEGDVWYDSTAANLVLYDGVGNVDLTVQNTDTQNTLDGAYDEGGAGAGRTITADTGAVQINVGSANGGLGITKTNAGAGNALDVENDGTGACAFLNQDGNAVTLDIDSEATIHPLINLAAINANTRGDISFNAGVAGRTADPSGPAKSDIWFTANDDALRGRVTTTSNLAATILSEFGPGFGILALETIATGVVTIEGRRNISLIAESGGPTDDLDTISPLAAAALFVGDTIVLAAATGDTITVKHNVGNIHLDGAADKALVNGNRLSLMYDGTDWVQLTPMMVLI